MNSSCKVLLTNLFSGINPEDYGEFQVLYPGVDILPLYGAGGENAAESGPQPAAALIRYQPGAKVPAHRHSGYEHIIVLEGAQSDDFGEYEKGTCVMNPPGTSHAVSSAKGCLVLAIWNRPIEVLEKGVDG